MNEVVIDFLYNILDLFKLLLGLILGSMVQNFSLKLLWIKFSTWTQYKEWKILINSEMKGLTSYFKHRIDFD